MYGSRQMPTMRQRCASTCALRNAHEGAVIRSWMVPRRSASLNREPQLANWNFKVVSAQGNRAAVIWRPTDSDLFPLPSGRGSKVSGEHRNMLRYNFVHRDLAETFCGSMAGV